jgi:uncharacterized protein
MCFGRLRWLTRLVWLLGFVACGSAWADVAIPQLKARVTDLTGTLAPEQRRDLERRLAAFEQKKGSQIAVLLVPTTEPETIEEFGIRVADQWKLGRAGVDDGAIVLLAKNDHRIRIEVGRGLEGVIPDAVANRIVEDIIVPHLRHGDFYGGLSAGVNSLTGLVDGEPLPKPAWKAPRSEGVDIGAVFFSFVIPLLFGQFFRLIVGRLMAGALTGFAVFFLMSVVLGLPLPVGLFLGFIAFVLVVGDSGRGGGGFYTGGGYSGRHRRGGYYGGGWGGGGYYGGGSWGGGGGWSEGGGSGDSGGFSGGGGGFSGGGASGQW